MKSTEFTKRLAKKSKMSQAAAADQLDRVVHEILQRVREGKPANLPGLGLFGSGEDMDFGLEPKPKRPKSPRQ